MYYIAVYPCNRQNAFHECISKEGSVKMSLVVDVQQFSCAASKSSVIYAVMPKGVKLWCKAVTVSITILYLL